MMAKAELNDDGTHGNYVDESKVETMCQKYPFLSKFLVDLRYLYC